MSIHYYIDVVDFTPKYAETFSFHAKANQHFLYKCVKMFIECYCYPFTSCAEKADILLKSYILCSKIL